MAAPHTPEQIAAHRKLLKAMLAERAELLEHAHARLRTPGIAPASLYEKAAADAGRLSQECEAITLALAEVNQ